MRHASPNYPIVRQFFTSLFASARRSSGETRRTCLPHEGAHLSQLLRDCRNFRRPFRIIGLIAERKRNNSVENNSIENRSHSNVIHIRDNWRTTRPRDFTDRSEDTDRATTRWTGHVASGVTLSDDTFDAFSHWPGFSGEGFPTTTFLADERAGTEAHVKVNGATTSSGRERRPGGENPTTLYRWDLAILWAPAALWRRAYPKRPRIRRAAGGDNADASDDADASVAAHLRALATTSVPWARNPGPPSTEAGTPGLLLPPLAAPFPPASLLHLDVSRDPPPATMKPITATWRFSWHRSRVPTRGCRKFERAWEIRERYGEVENAMREHRERYQRDHELRKFLKWIKVKKKRKGVLSISKCFFYRDILPRNVCVSLVARFSS